MKRVLFAFVVLAGALLAGCGSGPLAPEAAQLDAKSYVVPAGKSSIYYYRTRHFIEVDVLAEVSLDGKLVTFVGPGNFIRMAPAVLDRAGPKPQIGCADGAALAGRARDGALDRQAPRKTGSSPCSWPRRTLGNDPGFAFQ